VGVGRIDLKWTDIQLENRLCLFQIEACQGGYIRKPPRFFEVDAYPITPLTACQTKLGIANQEPGRIRLKLDTDLALHIWLLKLRYAITGWGGRLLFTSIGIWRPDQECLYHTVLYRYAGGLASAELAMIGRETCCEVAEAAQRPPHVRRAHTRQSSVPWCLLSWEIDRHPEDRCPNFMLA